MREQKKLKNTLDGFKPEYGRVCGNTTRLIDKAIQMIFSDGGCIVRDYYPNKEANVNLFNRIIGRLNSEHNFEYLLDKGFLMVDPKRLIIRLNDGWR